MSRNLKSIGALLLFLAGFPMLAHGQTIATHQHANTQIQLKAGLLNGESGEYVYDAYGDASGIPGYKISELQWDLNDVLMAGLALRHRFSDRFTLGVDYWVNAGDGDGHMVDYDWLYVGLDWSHRSEHPNTTVREVSRLDIYGDITLHHFDDDATTFYAMLGYQQDQLDWQARGGTAIYSYNDYRDVSLVFADIPGISYQQTYQTPYLGLGLRSSGLVGEKMTHVVLQSRYSQWVKGEGDDTHHLRDLRFVDIGEDGQWLDFTIDVRVELSARLDLQLGVTRSSYHEIKASTVVTDLTDGSTTNYPGDSSGLDHQSVLWSLGMNYRF